MRTWTGVTDNGYGYVHLKPETADEHDALASLYPGKGFALRIEAGDEHGGCHRVMVTSEDDGSSDTPVKAKKRAGYTSMKDADLRTIAAERNIAIEPSDKRADIIRKLNEAD